jgi:hypothetical protein
VFARQIVDAFIDDPTVRLLGVLVLLDFLLGSFAAFYTKSFRLSYFADVFRNDVLGKVLPYYTLWAALHVSGIDWSVGGLDIVEEGAGAIVIAALVGSILNSLTDLGLWKSAPESVAGPDPVAMAPAPQP